MTNTPEQRLDSLGLSLPQAPKAVASYIPAKRQGDLLFVSGQLPFVDGALLATGRVPTEVSIETATQCARVCALNGLAVARSAAGSLDAIAGVVRVGCWIASDPGFGGQPGITNAASELLAAVFGEDGRHARAAVGSVALPLNAPIEIEFLFALRA